MAIRRLIMKQSRLVKSMRGGILCSNCGKLVPTGTSRIIENRLHRHFICPSAEDKKRRADDEGFWNWVLGLVIKFS